MTVRLDAHHEPVLGDEEVTQASPRSFGFVFAAVFMIIALLPLRSGLEVRGWGLWIAAVFLVTALALPAALAPLSRLWLRIGLLLHRVTNPVVMGALFYLAVTPF